MTGDIHSGRPRLPRRSLLLGLSGLAAGAGLAACDSPSPPRSQTPTREPSPLPSSASSPSRVLLAYFSRAGENYHNGGRRVLDVGNSLPAVRDWLSRIGLS